MSESILNRLDWFWVAIACNAWVIIMELLLDIKQGRRLKREGYQSTLRMLFIDLHRIESTIGFLFECLCLYQGYLVVLWEWTAQQVAELNNPEYLPGLYFVVVRGLAFLFVVSALTSAVRAPGEIVTDLLQPKESTQWRSLKRIAVDQLKIFALSVCVGAPALLVTFLLLYGGLPAKWFFTCMFVSLVAVFCTEIYPVYLAPLFYTFKPLEDGVLRFEIRRLTERLNISLSEVYTLDDSERTDHSNAYITGFRNIRIVLYDNLLKRMSTREILAVIGHELGHRTRRHNLKHLIVQLAFIGNFFFLFSFVVDVPRFYTSFGFTTPDVSVGLVLFAYIYVSFANTCRFITNTVARRFEYDADAFSMQLGLPMQQALIKLHKTDDSSITFLPDPLYSIYHCAHPPLSERLAWMAYIRQHQH